MCLLYNIYHLCTCGVKFLLNHLNRISTVWNFTMYLLIDGMEEMNMHGLKTVFYFFFIEQVAVNELYVYFILRYSVTWRFRRDFLVKYLKCVTYHSAYVRRLKGRFKPTSYLGTSWILLSLRNFSFWKSIYYIYVEF